MVKPSLDARVLAGQTAEDHDCDSDQQGDSQGGLAPWLAAGDKWGDEDSSRQEGRGDPENRELDVPGARQVVGHPTRYVEAEEIGWLGAIMRRQAPGQGLNQEQDRGDHQEPDHRALCRSGGEFVHRQEAQAAAFFGPSEPVVAAEEEQHQPGAAEQENNRDDAPQDRVGSHLVGHQRLRRPVVGIGIIVAGPVGGGGPGRPGEECSHLANLVAAGDGARLQAGGGIVGGKHPLVMLDQHLVGVGARIAPGKRVGGGVISVGVQFGWRHWIGPTRARRYGSNAAAETALHDGDSRR